MVFLKLTKLLTNKRWLQLGILIPTYSVVFFLFYQLDNLPCLYRSCDIVHYSFYNWYLFMCLIRCCLHTPRVTSTIFVIPSPLPLVFPSQSTIIIPPFPYPYLWYYHFICCHSDPPLRTLSSLCLRCHLRPCYCCHIYHFHCV